MGQLIVTAEVVASKINNMKENKSPGVDGLSPKILKETVEQIIVQWLSSQICNVCALLETSTTFGILVDMVVTITTCYRTTSTAPPGGWWRHLLNMGTFCHTSLHNFGGFFSLQEMLTDWRCNVYQHFIQVKTNLWE